jgi:hypothetical protein
LSKELMMDKEFVLLPLDKAKREEAKRKADRYIARDGGAPSPDLECKLGGLGEMSPVEYGRRREAIAEELGCSRALLDVEWKDRRRRSGADDDADVLPPDPEPWPEPVTGAELLDEILASARNHLILRPGAAEICALWAVAAHAHDCFDISPVLAVTSPTPECGKTTLLTWLGEIVPKPLPASNITAAAVFRAIDAWKPTLLIDEADTFLRDKDELRGVLNSGHNKRTAYVVRTDGDNHDPRRYRTWAPKAIALIGKLPPTLASRSIHIKLQRKLAIERVVPLRADKLAHLMPLHQKASRWVADNETKLRAGDPEMPSELQSRAADNWRPLIAIADLAGGEWPKRVREIAKAAVAADREDTAAIMLLADLKGIFDRRHVDRLHSDDIVDDLIAMEDRPWAEWRHGKPMTKEQLAKLLQAFEVVPKQLKIEGLNRNGYELKTLNPLFSRYLASTALPPLKNKGVAGDFCLYQGGSEVEPQRAKKSQNLKGGRAVEPGNGNGEPEGNGRIPPEEHVALLMQHGHNREEAEAEVRKWR